MKQRIKEFQEIWKSDYSFSTMFSSAISTLISIVFALYNGALEIVYQSWWHRLICVYYLLLATIQAILIGTRRKNQKAIRMISDAVYVVDINGYIGEQVKKEIALAKRLGKEVIFHTQWTGIY